jgi:hypothetical protein
LLVARPSFFPRLGATTPDEASTPADDFQSTRKKAGISTTIISLEQDDVPTEQQQHRNIDVSHPLTQKMLIVAATEMMNRSASTTRPYFVDDNDDTGCCSPSRYLKPTDDETWSISPESDPMPECCQVKEARPTEWQCILFIYLFILKLSDGKKRTKRNVHAIYHTIRTTHPWIYVYNPGRVRKRLSVTTHNDSFSC